MGDIIWTAMAELLQWFSRAKCAISDCCLDPRVTAKVVTGSCDNHPHGATWISLHFGLRFDQVNGHRLRDAYYATRKEWAGCGCCACGTHMREWLLCAGWCWLGEREERHDRATLDDQHQTHEANARSVTTEEKHDVLLGWVISEKQSHQSVSRGVGYSETATNTCSVAVKFTGPEVTQTSLHCWVCLWWELILPWWNG